MPFGEEINLKQTELENSFHNYWIEYGRSVIERWEVPATMVLRVPISGKLNGVKDPRVPRAINRLINDIAENVRKAKGRHLHGTCGHDCIITDMSEMKARVGCDITGKDVICETIHTVFIKDGSGTDRERYADIYACVDCPLENGKEADKMEKGANKLKEARQRAGLTQREVAERVGIAERAYQNYEAYKIIPTAIRALEIARAVGSTVEAIYGNLSGDEESPTR